MIQAIIFDSDGMLTHGPRFSDTYAKEFGIPIEEIAPFFQGPFNECLIGKADLKKELRKGWLDRWQWNASTDELLSYWFSIGDISDQRVFDSVLSVRTKEIVCVLATNQEKYRTQYLSDKFGYQTIFEKIFSSAYVGFKKPAHEFFDAIFAWLQTRNPAIVKNDVLFWDDDSENVAGARAYGFMAERFTSTEAYLSKMKRLKLIAA